LEKHYHKNVKLCGRGRSLKVASLQLYSLFFPSNYNIIFFKTFSILGSARKRISWFYSCTASKTARYTERGGMGGGGGRKRSPHWFLGR